MKRKYLKFFVDYLIDIQITKTEGTYKFYENHFLHFGRFIYENNIKMLTQIDRDLIVKYLSKIKKTCSNATINKRVGVLKRCFIFYGISDHYIHSIKKMREKRKTFEMVNESDMDHIIKYINSLPMNSNNLLYKGIILILINTGVRLTELYKIERNNVDINGLEILLTHTKTGVDRVVYFKEEIKPIIKDLLELKTNHKYLLHNIIRNRPVNYSDVNYLFKKIKNELNIKVLHPHMFRHSFATNLLRYGVDIKTVMDLMGHTNLSTTQRYQHSSREHAKKLYLEKYKY